MTRLRRAFVTSAIATGGVLIWATPQSGGGLATPNHLSAGCPDARTCPDYVVVGVGWRPNRHHRVVIDYHVNPRSSHSTLTARSIVAAIRAAAAVWMAADPHLVLVYRGTTTRVAVKDNVFAFGPGGPSAVTQIAHGPGGYFRGHYIHFDVRFSSDVRWMWRPCEPTRGLPCASYPDPRSGGSVAMDLEDVATHEWGHVVGLEHASTDQSDDELTMWGGLQNESRLCDAVSVCRWRDTLGLGDILGVRHLYPTSAPLPTIAYP